MPAPEFGRAKRVTDPLGDDVKARLRGEDGRPCSRGSELGTADLSFFFSDDSSSDDRHGLDEDREGRGGDQDEESANGEGRQFFYGLPAAGMIRDLVHPRSASPAEDRFRRNLQVDAAKAADRFAAVRPNQAAFRRAVMGSLRDSEYNAGICKSRWESGGGGLVPGAYEYIDVVQSPQQRYIVDVDFAGEFEIARPTEEYGRLVAELPGVYVGRPEELRRLLRILAEAARRSLRSREMHVPPWRKGRYMQAKWLGPYRRTVIPVPSSASPSPPAAQSAAPASSRPGRGDVKCRFVGFDAASSSVIPSVARGR